MFFWEFPRRLKSKSRRFGTQCRFHRPGRSGIKGEEERRVTDRFALSPSQSGPPQLAYPPHWLARLSPILQDDSEGICITLGNDSMSDSKQKSSYEHGSNFELLRSYGHFLIPVLALM